MKQFETRTKTDIYAEIQPTFAEKWKLLWGKSLIVRINLEDKAEKGDKYGNFLISDYIPRIVAK